MRKPMRHQRRGYIFVRRLFRRGRLGAQLLMAPGTGKTFLAIWLAEFTRQQMRKTLRRSLPALVICRRDDFLTWRMELQADQRFSEISTLWIDSGKVWLPEAGFEPTPRWVFVTYDLVKNPRIYEWMKTQAFYIVIADEMHMIKRWSSARTKSVIRATAHIRKRLGMTGSSITNNPLDVFSQALFVDGGRAFGTSDWGFKKRYYVQGDQHQLFLRKGAKRQIAQKLKGFSFYVHEDDVLNLPPISPIIKGAPMSGQQRRYIKQVLDDWELNVAQDPDHTLELSHVITQIQKLRQIAGGFMYLPDHTQPPHPLTGKRPSKTLLLKCPKLDLLLRDLKDPDALQDRPKIIIWCSYTAEILRISASVHESHVIFTGRMSRVEREDARKRFRDDARTRFFIAQVDSGVGMNELVVADTAIYYSNSTRVVSRQQSMRRNRRKGSEVHERIYYYDYMTENSIDLKVLGAVKQSMDLADDILNHLRRGSSPKQLFAEP